MRRISHRFSEKTLRSPSFHFPLQQHSQQYKIPQIGPNALVEGLKGGARRFCPHINIRARRGREKQTLYQGPLMATTAGRPPMLPSTKGKRTARNGFRRRSSKEVGRAEYIAEEGEGWRLEVGKGRLFGVQAGKREAWTLRCGVTNHIARQVWDENSLQIDLRGGYMVSNSGLFLFSHQYPAFR